MDTPNTWSESDLIRLSKMPFVFWLKDVTLYETNKKLGCATVVFHHGTVVHTIGGAQLREEGIEFYFPSYEDILGTRTQLLRSHIEITGTVGDTIRCALIMLCQSSFDPQNTAPPRQYNSLNNEEKASYSDYTKEWSKQPESMYNCLTLDNDHIHTRFTRDEAFRCDKQHPIADIVIFDNGECYLRDVNGEFKLHGIYGEDEGPKNAAKKK